MTTYVLYLVSGLQGNCVYTNCYRGLVGLGGSDVEGYSDGAKSSTYTKITSLSLKGSIALVAEESCVRLYNMNQYGESAATRIGKI